MLFYSYFFLATFADFASCIVYHTHIHTHTYIHTKTIHLRVNKIF